MEEKEKKKRRHWKKPLPFFAERVKAVRAKTGKNALEFSEMCGLTGNAISLWEHEKRVPSAGAVRAICQATGCSANWLLGLPETDTPGGKSPPPPADALIQNSLLIQKLAELARDNAAMAEKVASLAANIARLSAANQKLSESNAAISERAAIAIRKNGHLSEKAAAVIARNGALAEKAAAVIACNGALAKENLAIMKGQKQ